MNISLLPQVHCPSLHHLCLWDFLATSDMDSSSMNLANHAVSVCKLSKSTMTCSWAIKHVKKYPFLFGDFVLVNFSGVSLFGCISILIQTLTTHSPSPCCSQTIFHILSSSFFHLLAGSVQFFVSTILDPDI